MAPIIEVKGIRTRFGKNEVHKGVSFTIEKPSVVAIIGGSGAGKSVLLRVMIGLLRPSAGTVRILGRDVWHSSDEELMKLRHHFGVLFQNGALFSALDLHDNIAAPLREQTALPEDAIDDLVALRLCLSGLSPQNENKMPSDLSGGMRKRAALARALAMEPQILFLDEPTSGLDPINARSFDTLVRTLCDSLGLTIVMITHDLDTLESICDRVIALADGKIIADGSVREVERIEHPWVRSYFEARVKKRE